MVAHIYSDHPLVFHSLGLGAAWNVADVSEGSTVVIFGLGTVGLSVSIYISFHHKFITHISYKTYICWVRSLKVLSFGGHPRS